MADEASRPVFIPTLYYRDALAAIRWLEQAFGFELDALVQDAEGNVGHSVVSFRGAVLSVHPEFSSAELLGLAALKSPASLAGNCTQFIRVDVGSGLDAHCEQAREAGARITQEPAEQFYGERIYRALDLEGHIWVFTQLTTALTMAEMEKASGLRFSTRLEEAKT